MGHELDPKPDIQLGEYRHAKTGNHYRLIDFVRHSETLEWMAFYEALYENQKSRFWVRPWMMWSEEVEINGERVKRFQLL